MQQHAKNIQHIQAMK